jgi:hypothetical protein
MPNDQTMWPSRSVRDNQQTRGRAIYDKALTDGDLLRVPVRPAERRGIAALLQRHHVHDAGYCGPGTLGQFPTLDAR